MLVKLFPNFTRHHLITHTNNLPGCFNYKADVANFTSHVHQTMLNNTTIIACNNNYNQLCFLKSLLIKRYIPQLNYAIKAAKELVLF